VFDFVSVHDATPRICGGGLCDAQRSSSADGESERSEL
jgi:hypothetical protein